MTQEAPRGSLPNRQHYLTASLAGGAVAALLSLMPVISILNVFFGLLIMAGGALAVYMVQKKTNSVEVLEATVIGALSGLVCGTLLFGLYMVIGLPLFGFMLADAPSSREDDIAAMAGMFTLGMCCSGVILYPMIAAIGGAVGGLLFKPDPAAGVGPDGVPIPKREPTPEERAKRSRIMKVAGVTCVGCLGICFAACGASGYLFYLEERDVEDTAGEEAVLEVPLQPGTPQTLTLPDTGGGTGRFGFWLVSDEPLPPSLSVEGEFGCASSRVMGSDGPHMRRLYTSYRGPDEDHEEWFFLDSEYTFRFDASETRCGWRVTPSPAVPGARIVVTRLTRPSDWVD